MATGYTRQSSASIVDGLTISAANHNNEFNLLETAFNGTSGHDHSGGTGLGPILLPPAIGMSSNGLYARTAATTTAARTITGTAAEITVTNGDGVSGNPTLSLPSALTFTGKTVTGGTFTGITDIAVTDGGTGASTAADARTNLGLVIGTNVQAYDAQLADVAGLTATDNGVIIGNGTNFVVESGATLKTSLGLTIGTNLQAWDADLDAIAALTSAANKVPYSTGAQAWALADFSAAGRALVDDADAAAQRATLGFSHALVQRAVGVVTTSGSTSNAFPFDDTIPQNTEGGEVVTVSITPKSALNNLKIYATGWFSTTRGTSGRICGLALFQDTTADALNAIAFSGNTSEEDDNTPYIEHEMVAGTTSSTTFKLRAGSGSGDNVRWNGSSNGAARLFGGVATVRIVVEEYTP